MDTIEYTRVVEKYANNVYKIALSYCKNKYDAEDILQNVFVKLFQIEQDFESDEHIRNWLIRVTINSCKDFCKSFWKKHMVGIDEIRQGYVYEFSTAEKSDLYENVMRLPQKYRAVIHLYYYEDYSIKEISEILGIKETTVQTQLARARVKLENILKEEQHDK